MLGGGRRRRAPSSERPSAYSAWASAVGEPLWRAAASASLGDGGTADWIADAGEGHRSHVERMGQPGVGAGAGVVEHPIHPVLGDLGFAAIEPRVAQRPLGEPGRPDAEAPRQRPPSGCRTRWSWSRSPRTNRPYAATASTSGERGDSSNPGIADHLFGPRDHLGAHRTERVLAQRHHEPGALLDGAAFGEARERGAEVAELAVEAGRGLGLVGTAQRSGRPLGEIEVPGRVALGDGDSFRVAQLGPPELAQRLEHPVAARIGIGQLHHRLVDEGGEHPGRRRRVERLVGADRLDRIETERAGEHRDPAEQDLLAAVEQVERPGDQLV